MKSTGKRIGGKLRGVAGDEVHKAWALYFSKFIDSYKSQAGVTIWGVTA